MGTSRDERYIAFCTKLKAFCLENGFEIAGTGESIYMEITVALIGTDSGWHGWDENKFNFCDPNGDSIELE